MRAEEARLDKSVCFIMSRDRVQIVTLYWFQVNKPRMPLKYRNEGKTADDMVKSLGELGVDLSSMKEVSRFFMFVLGFKTPSTYYIFLYTTEIISFNWTNLFSC